MSAQDDLLPEEDHGGVAGLDPDSYTAHRMVCVWFIFLALAAIPLTLI